MNAETPRRKDAEGGSHIGHIGPIGPVIVPSSFFLCASAPLRLCVNLFHGFKYGTSGWNRVGQVGRCNGRVLRQDEQDRQDAGSTILFILFILFILSKLMASNCRQQGARV